MIYQTSNPEPQLIEAYLKLDEDTRFVIPEYQRNYSWKIEDCERMWQDIMDRANMAEKKKTKYFFGNIIIHAEQDDGNLYLVDGQQRTTTFVLLLKAILMRINALISETVPTVDEDFQKVMEQLKTYRQEIMSILYRKETIEILREPNEEKDREIYKTDTIIENLSNKELFKGDLKAILEANSIDEAERNVEKVKRKQLESTRYSCFYRNFKLFHNYAFEENIINIHRITTVLLKECRVIRIISNDTDEAIAMFNSLNSTGEPLCDADIISAKLYANARSAGEEKIFNEAWKAVIEGAELLDQEKVTNIDGVLMQFLYYNIANDAITKGTSIESSTPGMRQYYLKDKQELIENPVQFCIDLQDIIDRWNIVKEYPVVKILLKLNKNSKFFLMSYLSRFKPEEISEEIITPTLEALLKLFVLLELEDSPYSDKGGKFKSFLFSEQKKFVNRAVEDKTIINDFERHFDDKWDEGTIVDWVKEYNSKPLVYVNEYIFAKEKGKMLTFVPGEEPDIEHIMPQSGRDISIIQATANLNDEEEFNNTVDKLGNKILLEYSINRRVKNDWFQTKLHGSIKSAKKEERGYQGSVYPIAQYLVETYLDDTLSDPDKFAWTKERILTATDEAAERIRCFIFE